MNENELKNCDCGDNCADHDCDCGGTDCNTITLDMEDGTQKDFLVLDMLEHEGKQYIALAEVDSNEYDILSMRTEGDDVELNVIEDEDEFNLVAALFAELFQGEDEETED